jgi:hypothetical protein
MRHDVLGSGQIVALRTVSVQHLHPVLDKMLFGEQNQAHNV